MFPIREISREKGKTSFPEKRGFSLLPNPHPFSRKARCFAAPLVPPQLAERRRIVAAELTPMTTQLLKKYYLPRVGTEHCQKKKPSPLSKTAWYFAAPLVPPQLAERRRIVAA